MRLLKSITLCLKKTTFGINIVDDVTTFISFNPDFVTDGKVSIYGNSRMEFHVDEATYIYLPNDQRLITTVVEPKKIKKIMEEIIND